MSKRVKVTDLHALPKDTSDHQPLVATVVIPARRKLRTRSPHPYDKTTRDGHTIDQLTNYALYATEERLKYTPGSLTVVQGSYNGGPDSVDASAGTHDGGGVVDLTPVNWEEKVHALRAVGFAAWHRPLNWDNAGGGEHIHAVLIGNVKVSPSAARQVTQYRNHTNGLANFGADNTWHPNPIPTFHMPKFAQKG